MAGKGGPRGRERGALTDLEVRLAILWRGLEVDDDELPSGFLGQERDLARRRDPQRGSDAQRDVGLVPGEGLRSQQVLLRKLIVPIQDEVLEPAPAVVRLASSSGELEPRGRDLKVTSVHSLASVALFDEAVAVKLRQDIAAQTGSAVEVVDVLRDDQLRQASRNEGRDGHVGQRWRGELERHLALRERLSLSLQGPNPVRPSKVRDAAGRGDASASVDAAALRALEHFAEDVDLLVEDIVWVLRLLAAELPPQGLRLSKGEPLGVPARHQWVSRLALPRLAASPRFFSSSLSGA